MSFPTHVIPILMSFRAQPRNLDGAALTPGKGRDSSATLGMTWGKAAPGLAAVVVFRPVVVGGQERGRFVEGDAGLEGGLLAVVPGLPLLDFFF